MIEKLLERQRLMVALITFVLVVLTLVAILEMSLVMVHDLGLGPHLIRRLPLAFYLVALWSLRRAMKAIGGPATEEEIVARRVGDVGFSLFLGGAAQVFVVPMLLRLTTGEGIFLYYDVAAITLGAVGFGLLLVSRLLEQALRARRELGEFV